MTRLHTLCIILAITTAFAVLALRTSAQPATPVPRSLEAENARLRQNIREQQARIDALEREVAQLRAQQRQLPGTLIVPTVPTQPGRNWIEREYNGIKYYLVPLESPKAPLQVPPK